MNRLGVAAALALVIGCKGEAPRASAEPSPSAAASARRVEEPVEAPPSGCKATGAKPVQLGTVTGDVHGFAGDATHLYYSSWEIYGSRGDIGQLRKDGQGAKKLTSIPLEPRELAFDAKAVFYTSGIRLMSVPKTGGDENVVVPIFSSQSVSLHGTEVFGVPGDYGPYDRLAKVQTKGGEPKELATGKRPVRNPGPSGFSRVRVDATGAYVTDSGGNRLLAFPLDEGKSRTVARADQPYDLVIAGDDLVFNLARKGDLMLVAKKGGAAKKVAAGLLQEARIAADEKAAYVPLAGKTEDDPIRLARVMLPGGEVTEVAEIPASQTVRALALDGTCVYWTQREAAAKTVVYALAR